MSNSFPETVPKRLLRPRQTQSNSPLGFSSSVQSSCSPNQISPRLGLTFPIRDLVSYTPNFNALLAFPVYTELTLDAQKDLFLANGEKKFLPICQNNQIEGPQFSNKIPQFSKEILNPQFKPKSTQKLIDELTVYFGFKYKNDWKKISSRLERLTSKKIEPDSLRNRFNRMKQDSDLKNKRFSKEEDDKLIYLIKTQGKNWINLSSSFPGRSPVNLKNRYYYHLKGIIDGEDVKRGIENAGISEVEHIDKEYDMNTLVSELEFEEDLPWQRCIDRLLDEI